ncbi:unnamed protein product [Paramecium pentaurelia]|uniref:WD-40 repeat protein n=1 Tax=Paramecium pentaurelia TaxID=43138 RepID=A0A8S1SSL7_9CILI|nr:unnamed protein product [Paramecium pentaurelia]
MWWKMDVVTTKIMKIKNILKQIKVHDFNKQDYSTEENKEKKQNLINSINQNKQILDFLQFLVYLTSIDDAVIQCGSNSFHILIQMKFDLNLKYFFRRSKFCKVQFQLILIQQCQHSGKNLNGSLLVNCKWKSLRVAEITKFNGHTRPVLSVCFSPDGNTLASGSYQEVRLWDVKTGQQKAKLDGHYGTVYSVCFSPNGNTLASGSLDYSIRLWDVKTGQQKAKLDGHYGTVYQVCFTPNGNTLASGSDDSSTRLWDVKTGEKNQSSDKNHKAILAQFKIPLAQISPISEVSNYITTLFLSQNAIFQSKGALILKGEFINPSGIDLKTLFKQKGSCFLEDLMQK